MFVGFLTLEPGAFLLGGGGFAVGADGALDLCGFGLI